MNSKHQKKQPSHHKFPNIELAGLLFKHIQKFDWFCWKGGIFKYQNKNEEFFEKDGTEVDDLSSTNENQKEVLSNAINNLMNSTKKKHQAGNELVNNIATFAEI